MRLQLWTYNYHPEPTGIAPVSRTLALALRERDHAVEIVTAHPHYPSPEWGRRALPYRERQDGLPVLRLPLWIGRGSALERYRQELTFMTAQFVAAPLLARPDLAIVVSPSFPALLPAIIAHRARRTPWVLWLHDILPDGATATGVVDEGSRVIRLARTLELSAYRHADRIVVLSPAFIDNLAAKGVSEEKIRLVYDPATRRPSRPRPAAVGRGGPLRVLSMGNIGFSQGLAPLVSAVERSPDLDGTELDLVVTGTGVAAEEVQAEVLGRRVRMVGVLDDEDLERELLTADIGLVTQNYGGGEFNIPSKLMNFMAYSLPIVAAVNPGGEVARLVRDTEAGWIVDSSRPEELPRELARLASERDEVAHRGEQARSYANRHFDVDAFAERFEAVLGEVLLRR